MEDSTRSTFGECLKAFRKQRKMTQQELAARIGVHRNTIGTWEQGTFLPESKTMVLELAHQLRLNPDDTRCLLETSLTALSPYWSVPHQRNPFFTGRDEVLSHLHTVLTCEHPSQASQSCALTGLGGVGKTQTVIEYAFRYGNHYSAVFWINAETAEQIISSFVAPAHLLNLPEREAQDQRRIVTAVTRWLNNHSQWLLIFDNVEDIELIKQFLPSARQGSLLFTSRRKALSIAAQMLDLEPMTSEEGTRFLLLRARLVEQRATLDQVVPTNVELAKEIVAAMDGLPLALDQAGAYIEATHSPLSDYLHLFRSSQLRLLEERDVDADHPFSVARTRPRHASFTYLGSDGGRCRPRLARKNISSPDTEYGQRTCFPAITSSLSQLLPL